MDRCLRSDPLQSLCSCATVALHRMSNNLTTRRAPQYLRAGSREAGISARPPRPLPFYFSLRARSVTRDSIAPGVAELPISSPQRSFALSLAKLSPIESHGLRVQSASKYDRAQGQGRIEFSLGMKPCGGNKQLPHQSLPAFGVRRQREAGPVELDPEK